MPRPGPVEALSYENSEGGACVCGAVFALDVTSHNLGRAMLDAYCFAAGDPELALELTSDEDVDEAIVQGYDPKTHRVWPPKSPRYRGASLYFVRLRAQASAHLAGLRDRKMK